MRTLFILVQQWEEVPESDQQPPQNHHQKAATIQVAHKARIAGCPMVVLELMKNVGVSMEKVKMNKVDLVKLAGDHNYPSTNE